MTAHSGERFNYLLVQIREGKASPEECHELRDVLNAAGADEWVRQAAAFFGDDAEKNIPAAIPDPYWQQVLARICEVDVPVEGLPVQRPAMVRRLFTPAKWGWAAAVLLLLGAATWFLFLRQQRAPAVLAQDITPGSSKATLTLADGSVITLDSAGNRQLQQGGTAIKQTGGQLQYDAAGNAGAVTYNVLTTPRGGQFKVKLPDGTLVWLNAASTIRYPTAFVENERVVQISGEAYFEVARNEKMPFRVKVDNQAEIEVLGTDFNVNAYNNEKSLNTTLINGSIKINQGTAYALLKPGQQAQLTNNIKVIDNADLDKAIAWKNGAFNFEGATLEEVMHQLERWYNIDVVYEKEVPSIHFFGEVSRDMSLEGVLKVLQESGVRFRMEGRKLVVMP